MTEFNQRMDFYRTITEERLFSVLNRPGCMQEKVFEAMKYSVEAGGKRIRPVLVLEFCRICGGGINDALPFACAIEMIHTYSLIHDDLPCMDDDDMRRGKPSCHKMFGEATALLAGDGLLNLAFETMLSQNESADCERKIRAAYTVASFAGCDGMIGGQMIDLENVGKDIPQDVLIRLYKDKTSALLRASALSGAIMAGAGKEQLEAADSFALNIGLAFQIIDDILDCTGDEVTLGKPVGSDEKNNKKTFVSFNGIENSRKAAERLTEKAVEAIGLFEDNKFLKELSEFLCIRNK